MTSSKYDTYTSPLAERNASPEMLRLWSPRHKFNTWRRIWLAVAEAQHELGLPVSKEQVEELRAVVERGITDAEMHAAEKYERELRHDVMAHVHALGDSCPKAKGIIHLGMTSQDVVCNAEIFTLHEALWLIKLKVFRLLLSLCKAAERTAEIPTLGFTHYQPAQPITVGRRIAGWASDLSITCGDSYRWSEYDLTRPKGLKGATGTQASFMALVEDDWERVDEMERLCLAKAMPPSMCRGGPETDKRLMDQNEGTLRFLTNRVELLKSRGEPFAKESARLERLKAAKIEDLRRESAADTILLHSHAIVGQTYPRVKDAMILSDLASIASVLHKIATDIRLLCNRKEIDEPFESRQIGSSAMPYKRNPMRCERICGLTRFVMNLVGNAYDTAATQWLERTLDDSSNRRLSLPEAFLALDGALDLMHNVASGLIVHEAMVRKNLMAELPFMATENILMACVKLGGDRQHYHELIRQHAQAAGLRVKQEGLDNDLLDRLKADKNFWSKNRGGPLASDLDWDGVLDPMKYVGRSVEQTERFIKDVVEPIRKRYGDAIAKLGTSEPKV